jgi:IclR family transcriptional regulator, KDG regulon repressor
VIKALQLLDLYTSGESELSLADITKKVNLPKPTVYRLLSSLEACGYLKKVKKSDLDIRYKLGMKLLELGNVVMENLELRKIALPHMQKLNTEIDEFIHLVILDSNEAVYIEKVESKQDLRLFTRIGKRSPLYLGSGPRLLLAYFPDEERQSIINSLELKPFTPNTITDKTQLQNELDQIRSHGFSISRGEQDINTIGISFPIRDYSGQVIAALGVSGLALRFDVHREKLILEKVRLASQAISQELGYMEQNF